MTASAPTPLTPRIARLRADAMARKGAWVPDANPFVGDVALWRAVRTEQSRVQRRAAMLRETVRLAPVILPPDWRLAGEHLLPIRFALPSEEHRDQVERLRELGVTEAQTDEVRAAVDAWCRPGPAYAVGEADPDQMRGCGGWGSTDTHTVYWARGWVENHSVRDYAKVLRAGYGGLRDEVRACLNSSNRADPEFPRKENFWQAALTVCEAGILLGQRYAELARRRAQQADSPEEQARLCAMAETCERVPKHGARSFAEAVQALWFAHVLTCGEDGINANSIGRLDQILYPYYEADCAAQKLTRADAVVWMEELACKLYLDYDVQAITLGGVDRDGTCAVNELSAIILEATRNVDFVRDVSVRLGRTSPPAFVELAAELIAEGGGIPFLFNDDCFIPALHERGIALADARDYAPIGCIELTVPGRANPHAVSGWFNSTKCLELALFGGEDPQTGDPLGPPTGRLDELTSYEDLVAAYREQVAFFAARMVYGCNRGELAQREHGPLPCWSLLTDDCIARGRDITDGGAVYNYHSICFLGTANTADSLVAIKRLVFEEGRVGAAELLAALRDDFDGREPLRRTLLTGAPKYGNNEPEVDTIAADVAREFIALMDTMRSPLDGRYFVHLFSFLCNLQFGKTVGATPDGRRSGDPLAYSLSAHQGRDESGVTAMLNSLAGLPHDQAAGASAAIVELDPKVVAGPEGVRRLTQLIQTAIGMGIGQLQWNVVTAERLRLAQQDPDSYGNIAVRVAGYSQMFRLVNPDLQEHIIARTKHTA